MFERSVTKSAEIEQLKEVLKPLPRGAEVLYSDIEHASGIKMDSHGRALLRLALKDLKEECSTVWGKGIVLSSSTNAISVLAQRGRKVSRANKRFGKTGGNLIERHHETMEPKAKSLMLGAIAVSGAIQNAIDGRNTSLVKQQPITTTVITVPFPAGFIGG